MFISPVLGGLGGLMFISPVLGGLGGLMFISPVWGGGLGWSDVYFTSLGGWVV